MTSISSLNSLANSSHEADKSANSHSETGQFVNSKFEDSKFENSEHIYINVDYSGDDGRFKSTKFWIDNPGDSDASGEFVSEQRNDADVMMDQCENMCLSNQHLQTKPPRAPVKLSCQSIIKRQQRQVSAWLDDVNKQTVAEEDYSRSRQRFGSHRSPATSNIHKYESRLMDYCSDLTPTKDNVIRSDVVPEDSILNDSYCLVEEEWSKRRSDNTLDSDASFFVHCPLVSRGVTNGGKLAKSRSRSIAKRMKKLRKLLTYISRKTKVNTLAIL